MRTEIRGEWPAAGVTFDVRRGSFVIPAELFEDGAELELARFFASRIPDEAKPARRERVPGGLRVHWRIIRVVESHDVDRELAR
ncbi:hypothetical protein QEH40_gp48 [Microbacterium phage OscarSo]|uniref:Uncharacterized protein n=1 Tax=Microbacterium phage OscarSo TaxID=2985324 RepID=A0A9X9K2T4_9CAUD|nr:hypothetical protein QEH40_gp48 [Microbacterium phage OscarSo]UYL87169.1 hypothetical protein SEA_OSCARSO_48 [Microbacterium phage OscarSo]